MFFKILLVTGFLIQPLFSSKVLAQTRPPVVYMEIVSGNGLTEATTAVDDSTVLKGSFVIELQDTSNISKIRVKLGSSDGAGDLFSKAFDFNPQGEFSDGTSLRKEDMIIYLGIGNYTGLNHFYAEAVLEDASGNLSQPFKFSR